MEFENILSNTFIFFGILVIILIIFKIFTIPISIAKTKNLKPNEITTIRILTWCGLFAGITWFIALFLSLFYEYNEPKDNN